MSIINKGLLVLLLITGLAGMSEAQPSSTTMRTAACNSVPAAGHTGEIYLFHNCTTSSTCTSAPGPYENLCQSDGTNWVLSAASAGCAQNVPGGCLGIDANGNVGWGTTTSTIQKMQIELHLTQARPVGVPDVYHLHTAGVFQTILTPTQTEDGNVFGVGGYAAYSGSQQFIRGIFTPGTNGSADITAGVRGYASHAGTANATAMAAVVCRLDVEGGSSLTNAMCYGAEKFDLSNASTITNAYGMYLLAGGFNVHAGSTITNTYGIYLGNMHAGGGGIQTNPPYSFYASDPTAYNYFGGPTGIGTTVPVARLDVRQTDATASGGTFRTLLALEIVTNSAPSTAEIYGAQAYLALNPTADITGTNPRAGLKGYVDIATTATASIIHDAAGVISRAENESAVTTVTDLYGFRLEHLRNLGAGAVTSAYGLALPASSGVIGTLYGLYMPAQSSPTTTYGVYIDALTSATSYPWYYNGTIPVVLRGDSRIGIGTTAPIAPIDLVNSTTATSVTQYAEIIRQTMANTAASTAEVYGIWASLLFTGTADLTGTNYRAAIKGYTNIGATATGTISHAMGVLSRAENESTAAIVTNLYGFKVEHLRNLSTGSVTNAYGLHIPGMSGGTGGIGTAYGMFVGAQAAPATMYGVYIDNLTTTAGFPYYYNGTGTNLKWAVTKAGWQGIGTITPISELHVTSTQTTSPRGIASGQYNNGTDGAQVQLRKSRGTNAVPTAVATGDRLGELLGAGYDGASFLEMGLLAFEAEGTIAATRVPTRLIVATATDAAPSVRTERLRIDSAGLITVTGTLKVTSAATAGKVVCVNATGVLSQCTTIVDASGNCTCP